MYKRCHGQIFELKSITYEIKIYSYVSKVMAVK